MGGTCMVRSVHGKGVCMAGGMYGKGGHAWWGCGTGGCLTGVRILLECIVVFQDFLITICKIYSSAHYNQQQCCNQIHTVKLFYRNLWHSLPSLC